jgi:diguanylate cyclase
MREENEPMVSTHMATRVGDRMATSTLRASVATSALAGVAVIVVGLALSWAATWLIGGAGHVVPHFYYVPILFAAVRFGPFAALLVAAASGLLAGPFTPLDVANGEAQDLQRWMSRAVFFAVIGVGMSVLVRPSLPSVSDEIRRLRVAWRLRRAIDEGELFLRYQPIHDLRSGELHGFEALVRWQHPDDGELAPAAFLPEAEASEAIHDLGAFVLHEACAQAARWQQVAAEHGRPVPCVAVNMSARELEHPDVVRRVRDVLDDTGVSPSSICLEITESAIVDDLDLSVATIAALKTLGVRIAVDDFGTGYSSLAAVHRFPIDVLKIDRTFVRALDQDPAVEQVLGGLVMFAQSLDLDTVVEGIERPEQAELVRELGFLRAQGYHFARPMRVDDATALVARIDADIVAEVAPEVVRDR